MFTYTHRQISSSTCHLSQGSSAATANMDTEAAESGNVDQKNLNSLVVAEIQTSCGEDLLHLYKNRLQSYAQKRNIMLPTYSCEIVGPPHARSFKSTVTVDGMSFQTKNFFLTLRDAEHAAAKVAYDFLSIHRTQEDMGLYKNLLQELAQKRGLRLLTYETAEAGPPHMPIFISTVKIGGENFQGQKAKTKRGAEMNAAKAAYISLTECQENQSSSDGDTSEVSSFNLQPNVTEEVEKDLAININISNEEQAKEIKVTNGTRQRNSSTSSSEDSHARKRSSSSATQSLPKDRTSVSTHTVIASSGKRIPAFKKILVCPNTPDMTTPKGATILPISDDEWVAMGLPSDDNSN